MPSKRTIPRVCGHCQSDFLARADLVNAGKALYCSVACRTAASRGRPSPLLGTGHHIVLACEQCGEPFRPKAPNKAAPQRFCGWACKSASETHIVVIPDDERDLIYFAGFLDGEGTITINPGCYARMILSNTHESTVRWVRDTFGGTLARPRLPRSPKHKPIFTWYAGDAGTVALCLRLVPYLKIKRRHAEIILSIALDEQADRMSLWDELRALNHRGVSSVDSN